MKAPDSEGAPVMFSQAPSELCAVAWRGVSSESDSIIAYAWRGDTGWVRGPRPQGHLLLAAPCSLTPALDREGHRGPERPMLPLPWRRGLRGCESREHRGHQDPLVLAWASRPTVPVSSAEPADWSFPSSVLVW